MGEERWFGGADIWDLENGVERVMAGQGILSQSLNILGGP